MTSPSTGRSSPRMQPRAPRSGRSRFASSTSSATSPPTQAASPSRSSPAAATPPRPSPAPRPPPRSQASRPSPASPSTRPPAATSSTPPTAPSPQPTPPASRSTRPARITSPSTASFQPQDAAAGASLGTVKVRVLDQFGNLTPDTSSITVAIKSGSGDPTATLSGTKTATAVAGIATFTGLSIDKATSGYKLNATDGALTTTDSTSFAINPAGADHLAFDASFQPQDAAAGASLGTVKVRVLDQFGNLTPDTSSITVAIKSGSGDPTATLSGTKTATAVAGIATFTGLSIDKATSGYKLNATDGALTTTDSTSFAINPAGADHLAFDGVVPAPGCSRGRLARDGQGSRPRPVRQPHPRHKQRHRRDQVRHRRPHRDPLRHQDRHRGRRHRDLHRPLDRQGHQRLQAQRHRRRPHRRPTPPASRSASAAATQVS